MRSKACAAIVITDRYVLLERRKKNFCRQLFADHHVAYGFMDCGVLMGAAIKLNNVTVAYNRHPAIHHISGEFAEGSLTAIAGPNGAGKSTLLKAIAGLVNVSGDIEIAFPKSEIAFLSQNADMQRDFPLSVMHLVATGFIHKNNIFRSITTEMKKRISASLEQVGLKGFETRDLASLSAGQFQRVLFARVIVQDAKLILLDEPFTSMDADTTDKLLHMIMHWHQEKRTVICVLHDFEQIRKYFPSCLLMAKKSVAWGNSAETLSRENLLRATFPNDSFTANPEICSAA